MALRATLIPGDGIGPEVTEATVRLVAAAGVEVEWERVVAGGVPARERNDPMPAEVLESIRRHRVCLKGPLETPIGEGWTSANVTLRKALDLYACVRHSLSFEGVPSRYQGVDVIVVRENTEGIYSGLEHEVVPGVVESLKIITERASRRIAAFAFKLALLRGRKKVAAVHKANIMKKADGLFLRCCREEAERNPGIEYREVIIDNCCMQLVLRPEQYDVLVMENFYGDIVSDLCAGLVGGTGIVPGVNLGDDCAVFEAVHGTAPDIAGLGLANPTALFLCAVALLRHAGENEAATRIEAAVRRVLAGGKETTRDLGGSASTAAYTDAVIRAL